MFLTIYLFCLEKFRKLQKEEKWGERSSIYCFTPQMAMMATGVSSVSPTRVQGPLKGQREPFFSVLPSHKQGTGLEEHLGHELAHIRIAGTVGGDLACYARVAAPKDVFLKLSHF